MKRRLLSTLFIALTVCSIPLPALDFRLISWEGDIEALKYSDGKTQVSITVSEGAFSPHYHIESPSPLILYKEVEREGKIVRHPVATLDVPSNITQAVILLTYTDATRKTLAGFWIDDSPEARPRQTVTYRNFSSHPLLIRLGEEEHSLPPRAGRTQITNPQTKRVVFKAAAQTGTGWEIVASTVQPIRPGLRTLVILRDGRPDHTGHKELIDLLMFHDYPAPPAPPASP